MSMRRLLAIALLLLVVAWIAWAVLPGDAPPTMAPLARNTTPTRQSARTAADFKAATPEIGSERVGVTTVAATVRVTCVDPEGKPVVDAHVHWIPADGIWIPIEQAIAVGRTDSAGTIELQSLPDPAAGQRLGVYHDTHLPEIVPGSVWSAWQHEAVVQLQNCDRQLVRVQDRFGRAIVGASVIASVARLTNVVGMGLPGAASFAISAATTDASGDAVLPVAEEQYWLSVVPPREASALAVLDVSKRLPCAMPADRILVTMARPYVAGVTVAGDRITTGNASFAGASFANGGQGQLARLRQQLLAKHAEPDGARPHLWVAFASGRDLPVVEYSLLLERTGWLTGSLSMNEYSENWSPTVLDASERPVMQWGYIDVEALDVQPAPLLRLQQIVAQAHAGPVFTASITGSARFEVPPGEYCVDARYTEDALGIDVARIAVAPGAVVPLPIRLRAEFALLTVTVAVPDGLSRQACGMQLWSAGELLQSRLLPEEPASFIVPVGRYTCRFGGAGFEVASHDIELSSGAAGVVVAKLAVK